MTPKRLVAIKPDPKMGDFLHICWMLHNHCNNRCSYCRDFNWKGDYRWLKYEHVTQFLDRVFKHYRKDNYHVSFTGGEPTLWPDFNRLCKLLRSQNCQIGLTSNGARRLDFWQELEEDFNWVCLSYHPEFTKDEHFLDVVRLLVNKTRLSVRLMMHKEKRHWERSMAFAEKLKEQKGFCSLFVEYVPLQDDFGLESRPMEYEEWQKPLFSGTTYFTVQSAEPGVYPKAWPEVWDFWNHYDDGSTEFCRPNDLVAHNLVNFRDWTCHIGRDLLFINHEGEILRGNCKQGGRVGFLFDPDLKFPDAPLRCQADFCPCGTDILVRKESPLKPEMHHP